MLTVSGLFWGKKMGGKNYALKLYADAFLLNKNMLKKNNNSISKSINMYMFIWGGWSLTVPQVMTG
uniref:Uncharacterized protein n=1 Tax=Anguilla anguilla TaxID=7936 RepID=A0A0E9XW47_ANGAN